MRPIATDVYTSYVCVCVSVCLCVSVTRRYPAETTGSIQMPFGMFVRVGPNHVLAKGPDPPGKGQFLNGEGAVLHGYLGM